MTEKALVLSIQSHMVHGRSGNRSAVLPLELNGINVDPLLTVHLSCHTAYPYKCGTIMNSQEFQEIIRGLRLNEILPLYTHILTGYIGDPHIIEGIANLRNEVGSKVHYLCDPVLGDNGRLYVSPEIVNVIKTQLLPIADTICPNSYEAEWLTDIQLTDQAKLLEAVKHLHAKGPKNVIISSTEWKHRFVFFSWDNEKVQFAIETPSFPRKFDGPGDVFAALLLANMIKFGTDYETISKRTVNAVYGVLKKTVDLNERELALPQAVQEMMNPEILFGIIPLEEFLKIDVSV